MSSEMRELIEAKIREWSAKTPDYARRNLERERCADELRALLARTEAGAYRGVIPEALDETINGVVSDLQMIAAGKDQVTGDPVSGLQSQRIAKSAHDRLLLAWNACDTHPHDASGDAREAERYRWLRDEASRAQLEMFADRRGTRLAADRLCDAGIDISMQAKEAK